ncbi:helix-turn-helix transcriptional regulator [Tepidibacter hydrothermalis]|uniref:Helix-turn-helix transcriptional regulator n=1 Tax=Tepidibacter hydrothermalis TaxID=3036126 RepID=A0ABY8EAX0_9FIRM|nr:helix-turn-helix transcriptional regulator [Tepidibacter hydrothermalis]WFD08749.1 helix-turn-helix transcriptional regulator [Tepidibacter hydrothermalis]
MRIKLKELRKKSGLKVAQISCQLNISSSFYYKIERGIRNPNINLAKKISDLFNEPVEELFFNNEMDESSNRKANKAS